MSTSKKLSVGLHPIKIQFGERIYRHEMMEKVKWKKEMDMKGKGKGN